MRRRRLFVACLGLVALASCTARASDGATTDGFLDWLASHRDGVGLAAYDIGSENSGLYVNADALFPLASTRKVLILGAYALKVASRSLDPAERVRVADVERWYWAGTDGGAHENASKEWARRHAVDRSGRLSLEAVVRAMTRWSDNAAADYVLQRVGGPDAAAAFARRIGMKMQEPIFPVLGEFLGSSTVDWVGLSPAARSARAEELAQGPSAPRPRSLDLDDQVALARATPRGTPREWAHLMSETFTGRGLPSDAARLMQRHLEWPLEASRTNRDRFVHLGAKGGSLPGVITEAMYVQPKAHRPAAIVLFLRNVPRNESAGFHRSFVHQQFLLRYAEDEAFRAKVRNRLGRS